MLENILSHGLADQKFIDQWVNGAAEFKKSLDSFTFEMASERCGLPIETLTKVAHMIAEAKGVCVLWAMGVTQHSMGSDTSTAISNLLLATGNYMKPGTGAYPSSAGHVVVIDDEKNITFVIQAMLRKAGYQVTAFNDSVEALSFIEGEKSRIW